MSNTSLTNEIHYIHIKKYLDNNLDKYNGIRYGYSVINKKNRDEILIISNLPDEIIQNYIEKKYQCIDPVIFKALNRFAPFFWNENLMINSREAVDKVFGKIKNFNIVSGYTFVLHDPDDNLALLVLYTAGSADTLLNINKNEMHGLLISVHQLMVQLGSKRNKKTADKQNLTSRESEILYWCSAGKTYPEIAIILGIKTGTVKFHMSNIVKKLGVSNAKHAISLSATLNIIYPPSGL